MPSSLTRGRARIPVDILEKLSPRKKRGSGGMWGVSLMTKMLGFEGALAQFSKIRKSS